eukprot:gene50922-68152_t
MARRAGWFLAGLVVAVLVLVGLPQTTWATDLIVREVVLEPCPLEDVGAPPELRRPTGSSCYALRGLVTNSSRKPVVDTDVFALVVDSSGEPVLQN